MPILLKETCNLYIIEPLWDENLQAVYNQNKNKRKLSSRKTHKLGHTTMVLKIGSVKNLVCASVPNSIWFLTDCEVLDWTAGQIWFLKIMTFFKQITLLIKKRPKSCKKEKKRKRNYSYTTSFSKYTYSLQIDYQDIKLWKFLMLENQNPSYIQVNEVILEVFCLFFHVLKNIYIIITTTKQDWESHITAKS